MSFTGKSVPTFRQELRRIISEWSKFRKALRKEEREAFDEMMLSAKKHASAAQYQANPDPVESVFMSVLLEQQLELQRLKRRLNDEGLDTGCISGSE